MRITAGDLLKTLKQYQKWVQENKPPYYASYHKKEIKPQYYYDSYHDSITKNDNGSYDFNIQTDGSPEGDIWEYGKFKFENGYITILEHKSSFN